MRARPRTTAHDADTDADRYVETLACNAAAGDLDALSALYDRFIDPLFRYIAIRVDGRAAAEDLAQDVWLRVHRNLKTYQSYGPGSFAGWLYTIARRLIVSHYRTHGRRRERITSDMLVLDCITQAEGPADAADRTAGEQLVAKALLRLTTAQRQCLELRFFQDLTVAETSQIMARKPDAVRQLQSRALARLAGVLTTDSRACVYGARVSAGERTLTLNSP